MNVFSEAFELALAHVLAEEGGWSDHPADPGGATYKGITLKLLRAWRNDHRVTKEELRTIAMDEVRAIYHTLFWSRVKGDELPAGVGLQVFDAAVNSGVPNAILALQRALKALGVKMFPDGRIGPKTLAGVAVVAALPLIAQFAARRSLFFAGLKTFVFFASGWFARTQRVAQAATLIWNTLNQPKGS